MSNWQRAIARKLASTILIVACALPTVAQTQQPQNPPPKQEQEPPPVLRPLPERSVGLTPGNVVRWTLRDAIMAALEKNVDIELERENVRLVQFNVAATRAPYDLITSSNINYNSSTTPLTNPFAGAQVNQSTATSQTLNYNFGISQAIERTGGGYSVNFRNNRISSNTSTFDIQYNPTLTVNFTQPLFRNFRNDFNRHAIKIAKKQLDLSDAQFRQRVIGIIASVQQAYWDLAFAIRDEEVQRAAVKLAETQYNNNKRQEEVGTLAPLDVVNAQATLESRRQSVFQAMNTVSLSENTLKSLTVDSPSSTLWGAQIIPVEAFEAQPINLSLDDAFKLAVANRPEMRQFALQKEQNQIDIDFYRDQAKPQVDLTASFGLVGLGGDPRLSSGSATCSNPVTINGQQVCLSVGVVTSGNTFVPGILQTPYQVFPPSSPVVSDFIGGYFTGVRNLFGFGSRTWSVGVVFNFPLRNTAAKVNLGRALEQNRQLDLQTRRQVQSIELEVRNAIQSLETIKMRIETSRAARIYAEKQYEGEKKKFEAGLSTTFVVLQQQNALTLAQESELRALVDYNKGIADLQRILSTTLQSNNIEIKSDAPPVDVRAINVKK